VLKEEIGRKIIDWWLPRGNPKDRKRTISWWGGEPLLEWELLRLLTHYAEEKAKEEDWKMEFGGTTNGLLYTPEKYEWLVKHKGVFLVSSDGVQPAHDLHRKTRTGRGSWKVVDKNLRSAIKDMSFQKVRFSFASDTVQWFFKSVQYFVEDIGLRNLAFSPVYESNWDEKSLELLREQFNLTIKYAVKRHVEGDPVSLKHLNDAAAISVMTSPSPQQNPCGAGGAYSGWSIDGYMYPCHRFNKHNQTTAQRAKSKVVIASIYDGFLNEEWRRSFYTFKDHSSSSCTNCPIFRKSGCYGGCYAVNFDLTGDIHVPHKSVCEIAKIQQEAGAMYQKLANEKGIKVKSSSGWEGNVEQNLKSCICYNMCYLEGTNQEITHIDFSNDKSCLCYQASYSGEEKPPCRRINHEQERVKKRFLDLSKRIIKDRSRPKSKKQIEMENEILDKTVEIL